MTRKSDIAVGALTLVGTTFGLAMTQADRRWTTPGGSVGVVESREIRKPGAARAGYPVSKPRNLAEWQALRDAQERALRLEQERERNTYVGTTVLPPAKGDALAASAARQAVAEALARLDPRPPARNAHFQWCAEQGLSIVGWYAYIARLEPTPRGTYLAEVRIHPKFSRGVVFTPDQCTELYEFSNGSLAFVPAPPHEHPRHGQIFQD